MENFKNYVLYSSVSYRRNISEIPFLTNGISYEEALGECQSLSEIFSDELNFKSLKNITYEDCLLFYENDIISKELLNNKEISFFGITDDLTKKIFINEEDHIKIICKNNNYCLEECYNNANIIDDQILSNLNISYSDDYGFLTVNPLNAGCAICLECLLFIPSIFYNNSINKIEELLGDNFEFEYYVKNNKQVPLILVRNKYSFGTKENEIAIAFERIIKSIVEFEKLEENKIFELSASGLTDIIFRSFGILLNSYRMSYDEAIIHLCNLLWGIRLNIIKQKNDFKITDNISVIRENHLNVQGNIKELEKKRAKILEKLISNSLVKGEVDV